MLVRVPIALFFRWERVEEAFRDDVLDANELGVLLVRVVDDALRGRDEQRGDWM